MHSLFLPRLFFILLLSSSSPSSSSPISIQSSPSIVLNTSIASDGDIILVNVSNLSSFSPLPETDFVGLYTVGSSLLSVPIKIAYCVPTIPFYNVTGYGSLRIQVWNVRTPLEFRYLTNGTLYPIWLTSVNLSFSDYGALLHPRILPGIDMATMIEETTTNQSFTIAWTSNVSDSSSRVQYGTQAGGPYPYTANATGKTITRTDLFAPPATTVGFFDLGVTLSASITILPQYFAPGTVRRIYYRAFDDAHPSGSEWEGSFLVPAVKGDSSVYPYSFVAFGDLGIGSNDDALTAHAYGTAARLLIPYLVDEIANGVTFIHLFGDLSYAVGYLQVWDEYLGQITPYASSVVNIIGVGNHEVLAPNSSAWSLYGTTANDSGGEGNVVTSVLFPFPSPANVSAPYYLFASGPVSLIVLSSEHDFTLGSAQWKWLSHALATINRTLTPWIIVTLHRQPYMDTILPDTFNFTGKFAAYVEPLLLQYRVNLVLMGHAHKWERLSSIYQNMVITPSVATMIDGELVHVYHQPQAPVYNLAGTSGADFIMNDCRRYRLPPYNMNCTVPLWSEDEGYDHGYLRLTVLNSTALRFKYLGTANGTNVGDGVIYDVLILQ